MFTLVLFIELSCNIFSSFSIYDDVDNHYLPVSYAGVKVKRKNWIKRSVSNAQDGYYVCVFHLLLPVSYPKQKAVNSPFQISSIFALALQKIIWA